MKPLSPELLVILALAHIAIGAEEDSDYFFRKAAYLHRTLTGQSTQGLDELLTKLSKSVGLVESVTDILRAEMLYPPKKQELEEIEVQEELYQPEPEPVPIPVRPSARFSIRDPNSPPIANERKSIAPSKKKSLLPRMSIAPTDAGDFEIVIDPPSARTSEKRRSSDMQKKSILEKATKNSTIPEVIIPEIVEQVDEPGIIEVAKVEEEFYTRKVSLSREEPPKAEPLPHPKQPKFDFIPDLSDLIVDDSILPPLRPSIFVPWNVTEYSNRLRDLISQSGADDKDKADLAEDLVDEEEESVAGVAPLNVIKAEYDQLVKDNMESTPSSTKLTSNGSKKKLHGSENDIVGSQASKSELRHKSSSTTTTMGKKSEYEILEIKHVDNNKKDGQDIVVNELFLAQKQDGILPPSQSVVEDGVGGSGDSPPVFVNRLGSELIWAGQLLLQLRMFDVRSNYVYSRKNRRRSEMENYVHVFELDVGWSFDPRIVHNRKTVYPVLVPSSHVILPAKMSTRSNSRN
ncbi:uncharacterized protein LOC118436523 [Folsomia candida]|uniref:uncharacterized protein LOC118436523 n=1 Tax=Folsomia candida TaxID=158441 RepID=UPI001604AA3E|nr:uncharacterized protein LOC118436523 [Folsomia candida]XP_035710704.1 uncharacterized protein LOC118436523 [Folsomia candida]